MSEYPPFFRTAMGRTFFEQTVPELVRQIARLNELLERLVEQSAGAVRADPDPDPDEPEPRDAGRSQR